MSLAVIAALRGVDEAKQVSMWAEYALNDNPECDPFAATNDPTA